MQNHIYGVPIVYSSWSFLEYQNFTYLSVSLNNLHVPLVFPFLMQPDRWWYLEHIWNLLKLKASR